MQFWHSTFGTLKQSFSQHEADVLSIATNDARTIVYTSGVDNKVCQFTTARISEDGQRTKWIVSGRERHHSHDVRALAVTPRGDIVSGGDLLRLIYMLSLVSWHRL